MKSISAKKRLLSFIVLLAIAIQLSACTEAKGQIAYDHIYALSVENGNRLEGTEGCIKGGEYIRSALEKLGYQVEEQSFSYSTQRDSGMVTINSKNYIAIKKGESPQQIIVGGHYDSVGVGSGADDNASAMGVILEVAEYLQHVRTPYTIKFIAFGGEEDDLKGSEYYTEQMSEAEKDSTVNMIVLDSLIAGNVKYVYGDFGTKGALRDLALKISDEKKLGLVTQPGTEDYPAGTTGPFSDHTYFEEAGIPYTYFEATDWSLGEKDGYTQVDPQYGVNGEIWHTADDTLAYIEKTFPGRVQDHLKAYVTVLEEVLMTVQ